MRTRRYAGQAGIAALVLALLSTSAPAAPISAPAPARSKALHDLVYLFPATFEVVETSFSGSFTILRTGHGAMRGTVDFATADGSATAGPDYTARTGTVSLSYPDAANEVFVTVKDDSEVEGPETVNIDLSNPAGAPGMILRAPITGTMTIIDDDGPGRISLSTATYSNFENRSTVVISLIRSGDASGSASITYSTADGTAVAGDDYIAVPPTTVEFGPGERVKRQNISLVNDSIAEDPESFVVTLTDPTGADAAEPASAEIELLDDDSSSSDMTAPVTSFHRPMHKAKYKRKSPYAKEVHISPGDEGSGLDEVHFALRMKRRDGTCAWYRGSAFRSGDCAKRKWVQVKTRLFIVYRLKKRLKPAIRKTGIRHYTAFARATDNAGNVEREFEAGRNKMRYRIVP